MSAGGATVGSVARVAVHPGTERRRPRLTVISAETPSEQSLSGFAARLRHFLVAARAEMEVILALIELSPTPRSPGEDAALPADRVHRFAPAPVAWRGRGARGQFLRACVQYPFDPLPYHCYPRRVPELAALLRDEPADLVVIYLPYLAHLVDHCPAETPVLAVLEEPWEWVVASAVGQTDRRSRWLARRETDRFLRLYRGLDRRLAAVVAIAEEERSYFGQVMTADRIEVIPHGVDTGYFQPHQAPERDIDVLVVGKLRAPHNLRGALASWEAARRTPDEAGRRWAFVGEIAEEVAEPLRRDGCLVPGVVDDVRPYYERARCVLVPALEGRGVKTTSLQAWSMARPLVASPVGAQGLPAIPGDNLLIGADPQALVARVRDVLCDEQLGDRLAARGRDTVVRERDLHALAGSFAALCARTADTARPGVTVAGGREAR